MGSIHLSGSRMMANDKPNLYNKIRISKNLKIDNYKYKLFDTFTKHTTRTPNTVRIEEAQAPKTLIEKVLSVFGVQPKPKITVLTQNVVSAFKAKGFSEIDIAKMTNSDLKGFSDQDLIAIAGEIPSTSQEELAHEIRTLGEILFRKNYS